MKEIRQPQQQRSIDKKNRIVDAGFQLFAERGYSKTTTPQIAKTAGVSTGIVYGYFKDKHDILLQCVDTYLSYLFEPIYAKLYSYTDSIDLESFFDEILDITVDNCIRYKKIGKLMVEMGAIDETIHKKFEKYFLDATRDYDKRFLELGIQYEYGYERLVTGFSTIIAFAKEFAFSPREALNYMVIKKMILVMLNGLKDQGRIS